MDISTKLELASLIFTVLIGVTGGVFALIQWRKSNIIKSTELMSEITNKLRFDEVLVRATYNIDYETHFYDENFHKPDNKTAHEIDMLLEYLTFICYLKRKRILNITDLSIIEYEIVTTLEFIEVEMYLWNIYHYAKSWGIKCTFDDLIQYGFAKKILDRKEFEKKQRTMQDGKDFPIYLTRNANY